MMELASLVDKSLLQTTEAGRYAIHNLLRQYAEEKLAQDSDRYQQALQDHGEHFAQLLEQWEPELKRRRQVEGVALIQLFFADIRFMWENAIEDGAWPQIQRSLNGLYYYFDRSGRYQQGKTLFDAALEAIKRADSELKALKGQLEVRLSNFYQTLGQTGLARHFAQEARDIAQATGDQAEMAFALNELGRLELNSGNLQSAITLFKKTLNIRREIRDKVGEAASLQNIGVAESFQGNMDVSRDYLEPGLAIKREINDKWGIAASLINLVIVERYYGNLALCSDMLTESLDIAHTLDATSLISTILNSMGSIESQSGNAAEGRRLIEQSLAYRRELGDKHGIAKALLEMGFLEFEAGNPERGREFLEENLAISHNMGFKREIMHGLMMLVAVLQIENRASEAAQVLGTLTTELTQASVALDSDVEPYYDQVAATLPETLGNEAYQQAFEAGEDLSLEEAIKLATSDRFRE